MSHPTSSQLYLNLLKKVLVGMIDQDAPIKGFGFKVGGYSIDKFMPKVREMGEDLPTQAHSMIGLRRMNNIQHCVEQVVADNVPGDLIETGVCRGGATIFMRALLAAYGITDRTVWVADSFAGLPIPDVERHPVDAMWEPYLDVLIVSEEEVKANFARYGLLDDQVKFLKGWFCDTLSTAPIAQLAMLRLDGDLYSSTWDVLNALYTKVAPGGFIIVDDYNTASCHQAITEFREQFAIREPIHRIDSYGVYWRRDI